MNKSDKGALAFYFFGRKKFEATDVPSDNGTFTCRRQ